MDNTPPSIFNDVIGPVMRGPSSSHTAASVRIGNLVRQILNEKPLKVQFEFDPKGSLATTYETQGSAMGLAAGLMEWEISNTDLPDSLLKARQNGISIDFQIVPFNAIHPNTYKIRAKGVSGKKICFTAVSVGGGMIEFTSVDDFPVTLKGDYYESLFLLSNFNPKNETFLKNELEKRFPLAIVRFHKNKDLVLLNIKTSESVFHEVQPLIIYHYRIIWYSEAEPVLPVISRNSYQLPFSSYREMLDYTKNENTSLAELALEYESARAGITKVEVNAKMKQLVRITKTAIEEGLKGTSYDDRILGPQSHLILQAEKEHKIIPSSVNRIIAYTSAIMEVKSSMGIIIAAPTAGSCGVMGGALFGSTNGLGGDLNKTTLAFLAAGLIGVFIAKDYTFAAEEGGCQVECGAASGMAAAGLVEMMGGNHIQAVRAASMALQNLIGLACDPVANRVEVPCLGKNILGATNALSSANMSMSGFEEVIPLDEVIEAMKIVGDEMPASVCCTGHSGLSVTRHSKSIYQELNKKK